jgi:hypothetical protein
MIKNSNKQSNGEYLYSISVAGKILHSMVNKQPIEIENVKVYAGDNFYGPADAYLNHLEIITDAVPG